MATKYLTLNMQELHVTSFKKPTQHTYQYRSEHNTHNVVEEECARFADAIDYRSVSDHLMLDHMPRSVP